MSSRNFRRACGASSLPTDDDGGEGYEPPYVQNPPDASLYRGLVLSSTSEEESTLRSEAESEVKTPLKKKRPKKKRGKGKASKATARDDQMDEIDRSVMEVNALLGEPQPGPSYQAPRPIPLPDPMKVTRMHLNVNAELKRLFGAPVHDGNRRQRNETSYLMLRRVLILPISDTLVYNYKKKKGVSMTMDRCEGDLMFFVFDHSLERQQLHKNYVTLYRKKDHTNLMNVEAIRNSMHVEGLMELAEALFRLEEYSLANEIIENVIGYLQYSAHPSFNIANSNVRLEYRFWENRPFHVAVMKFMYLLTNKACHRTALELAKMLLNLDPSDPLAVLFVIDTIALRAREHEWLIAAIQTFKKTREASLLFNVQYSLALAEFHVATRRGDDTTYADNLLQEAILAYPRVVTNIYRLANMQNCPIFYHELFTQEPDALSKKELNILIFIYAKMAHPRFREPVVFDWFRRNVNIVADRYTSDEAYRMRGQELMRLRLGTFVTGPLEVMRHIALLKHMAPLIFEEELPLFQRQTCGWDPLQDPGVNRYNYLTIVNPPPNMSIATTGSAVYSFFTSMLPGYNAHNPQANQ